MKNVAKFFPPWTMTRSVWLHALQLDVSGIAVDALLFNDAGRRLVHRNRISPKAELLPLILPVGVEDSSVALVEEVIELVPSALGSSLPPPLGFSPFAWPVNDGGMDVDELCSRIGVDCSPSLSPISRVCTDVSDSAVSPGVGVLISPIIEGSTDVAPAVGHAGLTLPSVDNSFVQDMLWAPAAPQDTRPNVDWEIPVPRWRLAREGPFLAEHSPESIRSMGAGCTFRHTTYRASDHATPVGDYGLPHHHPRFVEWIGVPQSAGLIDFSGAQWVNKLSRDQAVAAAVHLQCNVVWCRLTWMSWISTRYRSRRRRPG